MQRSSSSASNAAVQPFTGIVATTVDALRLVIAARKGIIPRITRRLNDAERRDMVKSGAVFIFATEESGIKRWTEGLAWSPSRIDGNFLIYREVTQTVERGSHKSAVSSPVSTASLSQDQHASGASSSQYDSTLGPVKPNGLTKRTVTIKVDGMDHHVVSYYRDDDVRRGQLKRPTANPTMLALAIPPELVKATNFRHPPRIEIGSDNMPHIYDDEETVYEARVRAANAPSRSPTTPSALYSTAPELRRGSTSSNPPHSPTSPTGYSSSGSDHPSSSLSGALDNTTYLPYHRSSQTPTSYRAADSPGSVSGSQYRSMQENEMGSDPRLYRTSDVSMRDPQSSTANTSTQSEILLPGFCYIDPPNTGTMWSSTADPRYSPTNVGLSRHFNEQHRYTIEDGAGPSQATTDPQAYVRGPWPSNGMSYGADYTSSQQQRDTRSRDRSDT